MIPMVLCGDCVEVMATLDEGSVDSIVSDPPYGLEFMGKGWDTLGDVRQRGDATFKSGDSRHGLVRHGGTASYGADPSTVGPAQQVWHAQWLAEAYRVLKPGGHIVAFGGTRTFHRLVSAAEDVGFEIRDMLMWHYGQGFPKSLDVGKAIDKAAGVEREVVGAKHVTRVLSAEDVRAHNFSVGTVDKAGVVPVTAPATPESQQWDGWGTALKPACEPIMLARKPLIGTVTANVLTHGTGALNIDGCRIETVDTVTNHARSADSATSKGAYRDSAAQETHQTAGQALGRWPANVLLTHDERCVDVCHPDCPVRILNKQSGPAGAQGPVKHGTARTHNGVYGTPNPAGASNRVDDPAAGAARFFYTSKANNRERWGFCHDCAVAFCRGVKVDRAAHKEHKVEWHPTVKPVDVMRWLVRLVTPPGGIVLDPFAGTGTTGEAALAEGFRPVLIEREPTYTAIAAARLLAQGPSQ